MLRIEVAADILFDTRARTVKELLEPLYSSPHPHFGFLPNRIGRKKILAAGPGLQSSLHPDDIWFRTFSDDIWCQYLEYWMPANATESTWFLESSNLHVALRNTETRSRESLVLVHSEPNYDGEEPACTFKRSPHLHVSRGREGEPMIHSHFPLSLGNIDVALSSLQELTRAISNAVKIVRCEVIDPYAVEVFGFPKEQVPDFPWDVYEPA